MKKSLLLFALCLFVTAPAFADMKSYWNGRECVVCPEAFKDTEDDRRPSEGSGSWGSGGPATTGKQPDFSNGVSSSNPFIDSRLTEDEWVRLSAPQTMMYSVVGPVKAVHARENKIVVENKRTHKDKLVWVHDPIVHTLKERNVVEVWLKHGSDRAESIRRLS